MTRHFLRDDDLTPADSPAHRGVHPPVPPRLPRAFGSVEQS